MNDRTANHADAAAGAGSAPPDDPNERVEVELKFRLPTRVDATGQPVPDLDGFRKALTRLPCRPGRGETRRETDRYFAPAEPRPWVGPAAVDAVDAVVRLRVDEPLTDGGWVDAGKVKADLTFKGPRLSGPGKSRPETVVAIDPGPENVAAAEKFVVSLGYRPDVAVVKRRTPYAVTHEGMVATVYLDGVDGVGDFVELEIVTIRAAAAGATAVLLSLARFLGLGPDDERRGYASLVKAARDHAGGASSSPAADPPDDVLLSRGGY